MTGLSKARTARRVVGALAALVLVLIGPGAASASGTARGADAVGVWDVLVTIYVADPPQYAHLDCTFSADQQLHCVSKPGQPPLEGRGVWKRAEGNAFGFWITHHAHRDPNGNPVGSINAIHLGRLTHNTFSTTAYTYIDMHDGSPWIGPVSVRSDAFRIQ